MLVSTRSGRWSIDTKRCCAAWSEHANKKVPRLVYPSSLAPAASQKRYPIPSYGETAPLVLPPTPARTRLVPSDLLLPLAPLPRRPFVRFPLPALLAGDDGVVVVEVEPGLLIARQILGLAERIDDVSDIERQASRDAARVFGVENALGLAREVEQRLFVRLHLKIEQHLAGVLPDPRLLAGRGEQVADAHEHIVATLGIDEGRGGEPVEGGATRVRGLGAVVEDAHERRPQTRPARAENGGHRAADPVVAMGFGITHGGEERCVACRVGDRGEDERRVYRCPPVGQRRGPVARVDHDRDQGTEQP